MSKYYFTFGLTGANSKLFKGGWVEVHADSVEEARVKLIKKYGQKILHNRTIMYDCDYNLEAFERSEKLTEGHNGAFCHEIIQ